MKSRLLSLLCLCGMLMLAAPQLAKAASAEEYPTGPVNLIVAYTPGGATDLQARISCLPAQQEKYYGKPFVVVNMPGAGGLTAWNWLMERGSRDGQTITAYNMPHFICQSIMYNTKYGIDTFEPLANWGADPAVLVVSKDSPFKSVDELVAYAKANPGKLTMNGAGLYVGHHIATLQLEKDAGIKTTYVPEKGGTDAMQSILSGKIQAGFNNLSDVGRAQDRLRILAIADVKRHELLPNVPTLQELGYKGVDDASVNYRGYAMPKGVDPAIVDKAAKITYEMFQDPEVVKRMDDSYSPRHVLNREQVKELFKQKQATLEVLLKDLKKK